jgi:hypothetical protein
MRGEHVSFEKSGKSAATFWSKAQPIEGRNPTDEANKLRLVAIKEAKARQAALAKQITEMMGDK